MKTTTGILGVMALLLLLLLVLSRVEIFGSYAGSLPPSRVRMEMMEMQSTLETYRMVHDRYPSDPATTERLGPNTSGDPAAYIASSEFLYRALSDEIDGKRYYDFKPEMLRRTPAGHVYIVDPDGNSFGYSTLKAAHPESPDGNNPTFDLWSTNGHRRMEDRFSWSKNW